MYASAFIQIKLLNAGLSTWSVVFLERRYLVYSDDGISFFFPPQLNFDNLKKNKTKLNKRKTSND